MSVRRHWAEHAIQLRSLAVEVAAIDGLIWFAVPNGGVRDWQTAKDLKDEGLQRGVPDLVLVNPYDNCCHFIEVKTRTGVLSPAQIRLSRSLLPLRCPVGRRAKPQ